MTVNDKNIVTEPPCVDCFHDRNEHRILVPRGNNEASLGCCVSGCKCRSYVIAAKLKSTPGFNILVKM